MLEQDPLPSSEISRAFPLKKVVFCQHGVAAVAFPCLPNWDVCQYRSLQVGVYRHCGSFRAETTPQPLHILSICFNLLTEFCCISFLTGRFLEAYLNGVSPGTDSVSGTTSVHGAAAKKLVFGRYFYLQNDKTGNVTIDEFLAFDTPLTYAQVGILYGSYS